MTVGVDHGSKERMVLMIYCPKKGPSLRQMFVSRVMAEAGYDVITRPVPKGICGVNPVHVIVDDWPHAYTAKEAE